MRAPDSPRERRPWLAHANTSERGEECRADTRFRHAQRASRTALDIGREGGCPAPSGYLLSPSRAVQLGRLPVRHHTRKCAARASRQRAPGGCSRARRWMSSRSAGLTYRSGASGGTVWRAWAKRCLRPLGAMSVPAADTAPDSSIAEESASRLCAVSCRHEPPRPHQRVQGACGARRPGLQARARPAPRQPPPAPAGSPIRPEHDSTRRWSPRRLPSSAPGALRCP